MGMDVRSAFGSPSSQMSSSPPAAFATPASSAAAQPPEVPQSTAGEQPTGLYLPPSTTESKVFELRHKGLWCLACNCAVPHTRIMDHVKPTSGKRKASRLVHGDYLMDFVLPEGVHALDAVEAAQAGATLTKTSKRTRKRKRSKDPARLDDNHNPQVGM